MGMLVLTRATDEDLVIGLEDGREIRVKVVDVRWSNGAKKVRLGVTVDRAEIREAKQAGASYAAALRRA